MKNVKRKHSEQELSFRVTARQVPTEELIQLFSDAFSSKKAKERDKMKFNDVIPF